MCSPIRLAAGTVRTSRSLSVLPDSVGADRLAEVPARELAARAALEIPLELECGRLLVELDDNQRAPRAMFAGVS